LGCHVILRCGQIEIALPRMRSGSLRVAPSDRVETDDTLDPMIEATGPVSRCLHPSIRPMVATLSDEHVPALHSAAGQIRLKIRRAAMLIVSPAKTIPSRNGNGSSRKTPSESQAGP